ncbi:uncharacterized protein DNG_02258 [Cephalotrichum gorgonifer]|uniref:Nephrocystin 3-like N-terminal domain-containing protein n=1 Tax=Cephalotrichum gorgonifer TaxID=2041049 RepID=A0AAE8MTH3_9PEZI|nr:uncharacterized protein DNG_02258 [Cephalotrichum gorgonifer]
MKATRDTIPSVGLTVLYEPEDPNAAVADIVFVAGLGGHPITTWLYTPPPPPQPTALSKIPRRTRSFRSRGAKVLVKQPSASFLRRSPSAKAAAASNAKAKSSPHILLSTSTSQDPVDDNQQAAGKEAQGKSESEPEPEPEVYWPLDLLPQSCPSTRILTWGCNAITLNGRMPRAQNDIFEHADDLLQELTLLRDETDTPTRPIIFITHSLGGVIVKEVLRRSEAEYDHPSRALLPSTTATLFFACPHRATEHGKLAEALRSMASVCLDVPPADYVLQHLTGSTGFEVEVGREAFVRMWNDWNFGVRCFREGRGIGVGLKEFQIRHAASSIGDARERAETFDASHLDICRFRSAQDPNYKALLSSLSYFILNETHRRRQLNHKERECLRAILPSHSHRDPLPLSYPGTCLWLYDIPAFQSWHHRHPGSKNKILWIKGAPGSGKSVLLRSLRNRIEKQWCPDSAGGNSVVWASAEGHDLDTVFYLPCRGSRFAPNPAAVYRSLLGQLFPHDPKLRRSILSLCDRKGASRTSKGDGSGGGGDAGPIMSDAEVVSFFLETYIEQRIETPTKRTFIFVDVADSSPAAYLSGLLSHLSLLARNSDFTICVASNHHPTVSQPGALEVVMAEHNTDDIARYVSLNLLAEWEDRSAAVHRIADKAAGVFLWAEIVVNILNAAIEEGAMQDLIDDTIAELPADIDGLYEWILSTLSPAEKADCLALMQWAILSPEPLPLNDLRVAVRLTRPWVPDAPPEAALDVNPPTSLRHIRRPGGATFESPYQFHRFMRSRSVGLLELRPEGGGGGSSGGGGVSHEPLGLQRVQVIHDSVRAFFLSGRGYACLAGECAARAASFTDASHYVLLRACLDYLNLTDFASLGNAAPIISPPPLPTPPLSPDAKAWRRNVTDQRNLITSSYPFLQYAVSNLLYHLLSPSRFRHSLPQLPLLRLLSRDNMRLYRRWTALLGAHTTPQILAASGSAEALLARFPAGRLALERVLRTLGRLSAREPWGGGVGGPLSPISPITPSTTESGGTALWSAGAVRTPLTPMSVDKALAAF